MPYKDSNKQRQYCKEWARRNYRIKSLQPCHITKKKMVFDAKNKPCAICGKTLPVAAMDLHHINPDTKDFTIGSAIKRVGYERLQQEIDKCLPLCAVCHRLLHAGLVEIDPSALASEHVNKTFGSDRWDSSYNGDTPG